MTEESSIQNSKTFQSPQEFYQFLLNCGHQFKELIPFMDNMNLFLNGCSCEAETYWSHVLDEYRYFRRRDFTTIKETLGFSKIRFIYQELDFEV